MIKTEAESPPAASDDELPDIVYLVMEMGRIDDDFQEESPSPAPSGSNIAAWPETAGASRRQRRLGRQIDENSRSLSGPGLRLILIPGYGHICH